VIEQMFYSCPMRPEYREEPCRSALNRVKGMMFGWSLNPYMGCAHQCTFCYVRAFERRAERPADDRYGTSIRVKTNVVEVLRRELARRSWKGETVAIGAATDPYQPAEGRYRLTRGCLEVLSEAANPFAIITRGPSIVRDIDVLAAAAARAEVHVTFSVPTLDDRIWRLTEPNTPPPRQRLRALSRLRDAGIDAGVGMAPILPGLSDDPKLLADVVKAARDAGATSIWTNVLYLRPGTREHFLEHLARDWPELLPRYERLYQGRAYLGKAEIEPVRREVAELRHRFAITEPVRRSNPRGPHAAIAGKHAARGVKPAPGRGASVVRMPARPRSASAAGAPVQLALGLASTTSRDEAAAARNSSGERAVRAP
jgi:DNA repair photolyase